MTALTTPVRLTPAEARYLLDMIEVDNFGEHFTGPEADWPHLIESLNAAAHPVEG